VGFVRWGRTISRFLLVFNYIPCCQSGAMLDRCRFTFPLSVFSLLVFLDPWRGREARRYQITQHGRVIRRREADDLDHSTDLTSRTNYRVLPKNLDVSDIVDTSPKSKIISKISRMNSKSLQVATCCRKFLSLR
jgi:hypothetical protein